MPNDSEGADLREKFVQRISWLVLTVLVVFSVTNFLGDERYRSIRAGLLLALVVLVAVWFIACFTGDPERNMRHTFVFAYAFTFGSFALLITPLVAPQAVEGSSLSSMIGAASAVGSAPTGIDASAGAKSPAASESTPAASVSGSSASSPSATKTGPALRPAEGALQLVRGCVVSDSKSSDLVSAIARCPSWVGAAEAPGPAAADAREVSRQFAWLVSIGGVTVREFQPVVEKSELAPLPYFVEIYGGLAVPLFVVILAFIGGAVSLSRRIPEIQRRSDADFVATASESKLKPFQARENVVFQIMQLVSAPFLAIATWYIVSPTTIAVAAGLSFGTGFASEPLLLMIRGMVEGIRPAGSAATKGTPSPGAGSSGVLVSGTLTDSSGQAVKGASVSLVLESTGESRTAATDAQGAFSFASIPPGSAKVTAVTPDGRAEQSLAITAGTPDPVRLVLSS